MAACRRGAPGASRVGGATERWRRCAAQRRRRNANGARFPELRVFFSCKVATPQTQSWQVKRRPLKPRARMFAGANRCAHSEPTWGQEATRVGQTHSQRRTKGETSTLAQIGRANAPAIRAATGGREAEEQRRPPCCAVASALAGLPQTGALRAASVAPALGQRRHTDLTRGTPCGGK